MLEQFRDVMIIIWSFVGIGAILLIAALAFIIFRKISPTLDSAKGFFSDLRGISFLVSGSVVKPTIKGASFVTGVRKALATLSKLSQRKGEKRGKGE